MDRWTRILWASKSKGAKIFIQEPTCTIQLILEPLHLEHVSGNIIDSAKLIRDIEVLALDKDYYLTENEKIDRNEYC